MSECHITEEKTSPLNSGNVKEHNNLPCWACHSMLIPRIPSG